MVGLGAAAFMIFTADTCSVHGQTAQLLGAVEQAQILPWGFTLEARVDTGAAKSSLGARELELKGETVEFYLTDRRIMQKLEPRILGWVEVRTNEGKERRPLVELEVCLGGQRFPTQMNLDDRSGLRCPMLIGRNTLQDRFLMDVSRSHLHKSPCGEASVPGGGTATPPDRGWEPQEMITLDPIQVGTPHMGEEF